MAVHLVRGEAPEQHGEVRHLVVQKDPWRGYLGTQRKRGMGKGKSKGKGKPEGKPVWDCDCGAQFNFLWRDTCRVCKGKKEDHELKEAPPQGKDGQLTIRQTFAKMAIKEAEKLRGEDSATTVDSSADSQQEERK